MAFATPTAIAQTSPAQTAAAATTADAAYVPTLTFDVASIRESKPDSQAGFIVGGANSAHSSLLNYTNVNIEFLLEDAYGRDPHQISGLPDWGSGQSTLFNVQAKSDHSVDEKLARLDEKDARLEKQHMMQMLLAERFNLKVHWETKEGPVYDLVVSKGGSKLHAPGSMPPKAEELKWLGDSKEPDIHQQGDGRRGYELIGHECTVQSLVVWLSSLMGKNVVDKTGLTGKFDFSMQYDDNASDEKRAVDPTLWPLLTDAVPDQLGLKLQSAKGPIQFLVIDHIEKPSSN
jgi:uncharacterized protein (TIGR03435 family)